MSGGTARQAASQRQLYQARDMAQRGYNIGLPALRSQLGLVQQGLAAGGEPGYVKTAWGQQRVGLTEGLAGQEGGVSSGGGAIGNVLGVPAEYGAKLARAMMGSRLTETMGTVEQTNKLLGFGLGGTQEAGSQALGAGASSLQAIGMMPGYNTTMANLAALGSLGGSIYGAFSQGYNPAVSGGVAAGMETAALGLTGLPGGR